MTLTKIFSSLSGCKVGLHKSFQTFIQKFIDHSLNLTCNDHINGLFQPYLIRSIVPSVYNICAVQNQKRGTLEIARFMVNLKPKNFDKVKESF